MNRPASPRPHPQPSGLPSLKGVIFTSVVGSVLVLVAAVLFALLPGALSEARDFRAARPCSEVSAPENGDCLSEWPGTVVSKETGRNNKAVTYWVTVDLGPEEPSFRIRMRGDGPVWRELAPGDRVTAFAWRDLVWQLGSGELRQDTTGAPDREPAVRLAVGLALLIVGSVFLRGAGWLHRRRAVRATDTPTAQVLVVTAATLLASGIAVTAATATDALWLVLLVAAAGCAAVRTATALLLRGLARRRTA
ncbi:MULTISPECIES: hypothetical protein [Streptomyces]|uniref:hypothetical protein n=1 Tax=Streptomyces TaxID=1883 RepID=UPI0004CBE32A|nr:MULTISPECIES: hypothetical protein [Streptomyces]MDX3609242.1 hypothetical protein [Streptomyces sp. FL06-04B]MDX3734684.1 hypothetical protein [Streptomyces sp. ID01-15D]